MTERLVFLFSSKMLHDGPLRHMLGQLTNTVYEEPTIDDFGEHGQLLSKGDGEVCPYTLFLGIFVSLLPKVPDMKKCHSSKWVGSSARRNSRKHN